MKIERRTFEIYWSYYKSIENIYINTIQYVSPSNSNKETYSDEYSKIILLCGSEIDSILKLICKLEGISPENNDYTMKDYSKIISNSTTLKKQCYSPMCMTTIKENCLIISPFSDIKLNTAYSGLNWWKDYQSLKHNRMENAINGNLQNATSTLIAHYILIRFLINYLGENCGVSYVKEHNTSQILIPCI